MGFRALKFYGGKVLVQLEDDYAVINKYAMTVDYRGTREQCEKYFRDYIGKLAGRDPVW